MPVQAAPLHPEGRKAKLVPPFLMALFTVQSGVPSPASLITPPAGKVMSFCVPAIICPAVDKVAVSFEAVPSMVSAIAGPDGTGVLVGPSTGVLVGPPPGVLVGGSPPR